MDAQPSDPLLSTAVLMLAFASFAVWFVIAGRLMHGPILPYEPRRPVPWSGYWTFLPIGFVLLVLGSAIFGGEPKADEKDALTPIEHLTFGSLQQIILAGVYLAVVASSSRAKWSDLGLPNSFQQLIGDVRIGVIAWLAALAPVYGMQLVLVWQFGEPKGHPLINMLQSEAAPLLFLVAFFAAVVVAPVCEEILFRLLLQGWLEKWEDSVLGWRAPPAPSILLIDEQGEAIQAESLPDVQSELSPEGLAQLPFGSLPIILSSLLFALAHFGYGPDPIPLFLLALILGYVYQRTHRIIPCMVTHALFNSMSLFALWRVVSLEAQ